MHTLPHSLSSAEAPRPATTYACDPDINEKVKPMKTNGVFLALFLMILGTLSPLTIGGPHCFLHGLRTIHAVVCRVCVRVCECVCLFCVLQISLWGGAGCGDLTTLSADGIVNSAQGTLLPTGLGLNGQVHSKGGSIVTLACR